MGVREEAGRQVQGGDGVQARGLGAEPGGDADLSLSPTEGFGGAQGCQRGHETSRELRVTQAAIETGDGREKSGVRGGRAGVVPPHARDPG